MKMLTHVAAVLSTSAPGATIFEFTNTSKPWIVTNDPVMGGVSNSVFKVADGLGVWTGEVKIVPFLHAPGTCQSEAAPFAPMDCSDFDAIEITLASTGALRSFQVSWGGTRFSSYTSAVHTRLARALTIALTSNSPFHTRLARALTIALTSNSPFLTGPYVPKPAGSPPYRKNAYKAPFNVTETGAFETIIVPMSAFTSSYSTFTGGCTDHGAVCCSSQHPEVCPSSLTKSKITDIGIDAQGVVGKFSLRIKTIRAIKQ